MQTVKFRAGDTIISEGEDGNTAFLIISGSVEVSIGQAPKAKTVGTLGAGDVFGEMSLIEPGPRSATVKAVTDTECVVTTYDEFIPSDAERSATGDHVHEDARPQASRDEQFALHRTGRGAGPAASSRACR